MIQPGRVFGPVFNIEVSCMGAIWSYTLIILGLALLPLAMVGCIIPAIPGPALAVLSLILLSLAKGWGVFSLTFWIVMLLLLLLVTLADYFIPLIGAQRYGASKMAMLGGTIGMIVGIFVIPPFGVFIGAFAGAVIAELIQGMESRQAVSVGWGVLLGSLASIGVQLAYCMLVLFFYVKGALF